MPLITDIKPQKNNKRFNIYLDGQFAFGLPAETLVKAGLKIDQEISEEKIERLIKEDDFVRIYNRVLKFLSFRPRSEKELKDWSKKKNVGEETQKLVYQRLKHLGYLNDEEFAKWWIEQRTTFRPSGARLIALELRQKGVPREIIDKLLFSSPSALITERAQALKIAKKKRERLKGLSHREAREKLGAFLARRGFSWETIEEVLVDEKLGK